MMDRTATGETIQDHSATADKEPKISLNAKEIADVKTHIAKLRKLVANPMFVTQTVQAVYRDKVKVEVSAHESSVKCMQCTSGKKRACDGYRSEEESLFICANFAQEVRDGLSRLSSGRRGILRTEKRGKFVYKLQYDPRGGRGYWYLQFPKSGRTTQMYLGVDEPAFEPETDIEAARKRKYQLARKRRTKNATQTATDISSTKTRAVGAPD